MPGWMEGISGFCPSTPLHVFVLSHKQRRPFAISFLLLCASVALEQHFFLPLHPDSNTCCCERFSAATRLYLRSVEVGTSIGRRQKMLLALLVRCCLSVCLQSWWLERDKNGKKWMSNDFYVDRESSDGFDTTFQFNSVLIASTGRSFSSQLHRRSPSSWLVCSLRWYNAALFVS